MQLDPRTVSRRYLLERAGFKRPDLSVVAPWTDATRELLDRLDAVGRDRGLTIQVIRFGRSSVGEESLPADSGSSSSRRGALSLLSVLPETGENPVAAINRAAAAAIGRIFLFGEPSPDRIAGLAERFLADPWLGAVSANPRDRGEDFRSGLAVRGDLWMALGGLDDAFETTEWALRDFFLRTRAIGFTTETGADPQEVSHPEPNAASDRDLFETRASLAPDRSGVETGPGETPVSPDQLSIYTAITDRYDTLKPQLPSAVGGSPLVAFLDDATAGEHDGRLRGWQSVPGRFPDIGAKRASRFFKANSHLALPQSQFSLWIDASVSLVAPFGATRLAEMFLRECDLCVFRHHARQSVREEADTCKALGLDTPEIIDDQIDRYRREGFPDDTGLAELPIILRRHSKTVEAFNEAWWAEIVNGSWRDQLSFNYVAWKTGLRYATFPLSLVIQNGLFVKFRR